MRTRILVGVFWVLSIGTLAAQSLTIADMLRLVTKTPATFEQEMEAKGYTCYQRKKTLTNWSCLFMDQRPAYLNQPAMSSQVMSYVFGPNATTLVDQTKSIEVYNTWHNELLALGFSLDKRPQSNEGVGLQYTKDRISVVLRKVDSYNGISENLSGYSASVTWMRQPPLLPKQDRVTTQLTRIP
ncbi:hypothetical protein [Fibrella forsythiae]|uniref:Uncharacterized protein n=1 Tax=Fibrella forsythiae TaxID=2817061 RepID=A0ABS3JMA7_9BACT|nr:hypothetical protein [Fibrella forsythiae]MBO0951145.1 hypothetical protein [Fibrella forsythiae]